MNVASKVLAKLGTVLVDRRLWIGWVVPSILLLVGGPTLVNEYGGNDPQVANTVMLITNLIVFVLNPLGIVFSWQQRPPSGLQPVEDGKIMEVLREAGAIPR